MLALTADIAEELLLIKDAERDTLPDGLKLKIISLAELAATADAPESAYTSDEGETSVPPEADSVTPEAEITESQEEACQHEEPAEEAEEEAESAEFEEEADACPMEEVLPAKEEAVDEGDEIEEKKIVESEPATDIDDEKVCEVSGDENSDDSGNLADDAACDGQAGTQDAAVAEEAVEPEMPEQPEQYRRHVTPDDLYRAFSINDAFFFRREIFGGSKPQMMEALVRISMLPDKKALQEYLVERLALDIDETPGKEFYQSLAALL